MVYIKADKEQSFQNFQRVKEATAARLRAQKEAQIARDSAGKDAAAALASTGNLAEGWVASSAVRSTEQPTEEPTQQTELHAKVQAFLKSRPQVADADSFADVQDLRGTDNGHALETEADIVEASSDYVKADASADAEDAETKQSDVTSSLPEAVEEFAWTSFQKKRLGRIGAECRYDFKKVASLLSEEFSCPVEADACRLQYRELLKPGGDGGKADSGRARDAPDMEPAEVQEASKWWVRQLSLQKNISRPKLSQQLPVASQEDATVVSAVMLDEIINDGVAGYHAYGPSGDGFHMSGAPAVAQPGNSLVSAMGSLLGDKNVERSAASATPSRMPVADVSIGGCTTGERGVASTGAESGLFDLD